jgi:uncharacterized integral membrane protein
VRRHDLDWVSLIAGAVFLLLAIGYAVGGVTDLELDGRVVWPIVLVALGAGGIAAAVSANAREERAFAAQEDPQAPPPSS